MSVTSHYCLGHRTEVTFHQRGSSARFVPIFSTDSPTPPISGTVRSECNSHVRKKWKNDGSVLPLHMIPPPTPSHPHPSRFTHHFCLWFARRCNVPWEASDPWFGKQLFADVMPSRYVAACVLNISPTRCTNHSIPPPSII
jgi:hypothetical protein